MTVIAGLVEDGSVYIGGDSAGIAGYGLTVRADAKTFANGPFVFGFAGSFRMGQILRYRFNPPEPTGDLDRFLTTTWIDAVRDAFKDAGWAYIDSSQEVGGCFLMGVAGRLFTIDSDFQVGESADGFAAVGCGQDPALGALYATAGKGLGPPDRILLALQAAERFSAGVRGPFTITRGSSSPAPDGSTDV